MFCGKRLPGDPALPDAWSIDWRIHHTAYEMNLKPLVSSKRWAAFNQTQVTFIDKVTEGQDPGVGTALPPIPRNEGSTSPASPAHAGRPCVSSGRGWSPLQE
jgi:hypothetical protein